MAWWRELTQRARRVKHSLRPMNTKRFANWSATPLSVTGLSRERHRERVVGFVVRLPQSLHAALEREAATEGVSLNQLVIAKLAVGLGRLTSLAREPGIDGYREPSAT
jgi:hypothetical protein